MNLLGPELVRDLVSLIQRAEADDAYKVLVFKSGDPDYFISHVDLTRVAEYRAGSGEADRRTFDRAAVPPPEREPPRHHRADRRSRAIRRQRVRAGVRHAVRRARVRGLRAVRVGVRSDPGRRRDPAPRAADGPRPRPRGPVERRGLRRRPRGTVRLDQSSPAGERARRVRPSARRADRERSRPPACSRSRTASTRSRSHRPTTSVAIPISSAKRCATSRRNAESKPPCARGLQTRHAELDFANIVDDLAT